MRWNRKSLLKACEALLLRDDCRLQLRRINTKGVTATCSFSYTAETGIKNIILTVDPTMASLVEGFLHEALHVVLVEEVRGKFNETLEEILISALERDLWVKAIKPGDTARWRKIINGKLKSRGSRD